MSSKINMKQQKRDGRPRSTDKLRKGKRDGTPDKPSTPITSQDALMEEGTPQPERQSVIVNEEILALKIKQEELQKLREPRPPGERRPTPPKTSVVVRKMKPASEWDKPKPRTVIVARPAPPDAPLVHRDFSEAAGLRLDESGDIIEHSLLGTVEDYKTQAAMYGDVPPALTEIRERDVQPRVLSAKYERPKSGSRRHPKYQSVEDSNALRNWQAKMMERKRQQGHLSKLLNKPPEQLVMNQSDTYRQTQELRYLIDRTVPSMDAGKGYRIGSEFWKQQERVGNDLTGMHMTMTQTERGYPPPIQHIGVSKTVLEEKGTNWVAPSTPFHKPWHRSAYLEQRKAQLEPVMKELDPHIPDILNLELVGKPLPEARTLNVYDSSKTPDKADQQALDEESDIENLDPLRDHTNVHHAPVFGPAIRFAGSEARWTGDCHSLENQVGLEARVTMESYAGKRTTAFLEVVNEGTTSIYYNWKKLAMNNPFDIVSAKIQRFYFNNSSGVVLPGDNVKFPFVFKSPNAGVFTEQWQFQTRPVVCGGAALVVTLRGTALQEDTFQKQRTELERELAERQVEQIVRGVLEELVDGIRTPPRPASPIDAYITEEEVFRRNNSKLSYHNETVGELKTLYKDLFPEDQREVMDWDLDVAAMKEMILQMEMEEEVRDELLARLNASIRRLAFPHFKPARAKMYEAGYKLLCELSDSIANQSVALRSALGLPDKDTENIPEEPISPIRAKSGSVRSARSVRSAGGESAVSDSSTGTTKPTSKPSSGRSSAGRSESRRAIASRGPKPESRESKKATKDVKGATKTPSKEVAKGGGKAAAAAAGPSPVKRASERDRDHVTCAERVQSPSQSTREPLAHSKYTEKMYTQTYMLVSEMVDRMGEAFSEIEWVDVSRWRNPAM